MTSAGHDRSQFESATTWHTRRSDVLRADAEREGRRSNRIANLRFVLFVAFLATLAFSEARTIGGLGLGLASVPLVGFVIAIFVHQRTRQRQAWLDAGVSVHLDAIHRVNREWNVIEYRSLAVPADHPYAHDLDVVGQASLTHLLSAVRTPAGRATLHRWLLAGADREVVQSRQQAVRELTTHRDFRERLEIAARLHVRPGARSLVDLNQWLNEPSWLAEKQWLIWYGRLSSVVTLALVSAHIAGVVPYALWLFPVILNFVISRAFMPVVHGIFQRATSGEGAFIAYENILRILSQEPLTAPRLVELEQRVRGEGWSAPDAIASLRNIASLAEVRRSFISPFLQAAMLWDVYVLRRLELWRERWHDLASSWFDVAAEIEVLSAFGGLQDDNPDWCLPTLSDGSECTIEAKQLGHPLLPEAVRVANDLTIGPRGTFVFVTGSNMSGKSTLLRGVGCNVVLAQAGAPVCCAALTLPVVRPFTNMRVSDSLASGESYYLAALLRLKLVVDAAREASTPGPPVLYLLDEILQGTNSAERKVAVQSVLRELIELHAIGAITSHDLSLIDDVELADVANSVHFAETVHEEAGEAVMTFDYKLRPGIATTRNALRMMEIIGLRVEPARRKPD